MTRGSMPNRTLVRASGSIVAAVLVLAFTMLPAQAGATPVITSFSPTSGAIGKSVDINGSNFTGATTVAFNGTVAGFSVNVAGTLITALVPPNATTGPISVTTPSGTAVTASSFIVVPGPSIASFSPTFGPVGTVVTINGSKLNGVTQVKFAGKAATTFTSVSSTQISATVPGNATSGKITVTTPAGSAVSATGFTVVVPSIPRITNFTPKRGDAGTAVTIYGRGFHGTSAVRFNGMAASSFVVVTDKKLTTTVPSGATTGPITVTNPLGTGTSFGVFAVVGPQVKGFTPRHGTPGTTVTINGLRFTGTISVKFNGTAATFTFVNDNTLTALVPEGATTGPISVSTSTSTGTSVGDFTVIGSHARKVTLSIGRRGLFAGGQVSVKDGYNACRRFVPVVIKRLLQGHWRWVVTLSTHKNGSFHGSLPDRPGSYRAKARRVALANGAICRGARSGIVHIG